MDATYWGWRFGVVIFKDFRTKKILWHKYIRKKEMLSDYLEGVDWLRKHGFTVEAIVCDGLRGMFTLFSCYPVQMCQFHQVSIVRRYLTKQPELEASKELWSIVKVMSHTDKESFIGEFLSWELEVVGLFERAFCGEKNRQKTLHSPTTSKCLFEPKTEHEISLDFLRLSRDWYSKHK